MLPNCFLILPCKNREVLNLEATPGFEPGNQGFADPCLTAWLCRRKNQMHRADDLIKALKAILSAVGADDEARTRYLHLGKVALYQMSYARRWCPEPESNQRHVDFQSTALPTELSGQIFLRAETARLGNFNPERDPRDGNPSRGRWRPGTGSNRRPLA